MKLRAHITILLLFLTVWSTYAQDKIFLRTGKVIPCKIVAISENSVSYIDSTQSTATITLPKNDVLITEYASRSVYMFSKDQPTDFKVINGNAINTPTTQLIETREQRQERKLREWKEKEALLSNNILGFYIIDLAFGRLTVSYERLLNNKSLGIKIPLSLTFDGLGALAEFSSNNSNAANTNTYSTGTGTYTSSGNTTNPPVQRNRGTGFISGIDVNYYHDLKPQLKYYFGPRIRYGTDMTLGGIEGLSFQIQNGIFKSSGNKMTSTFGFGFGFVKLSERYAQRLAIDTRQVYPWASLTWRLGFRL